MNNFSYFTDDNGNKCDHALLPGYMTGIEFLDDHTLLFEIKEGDLSITINREDNVHPDFVSMYNEEVNNLNAELPNIIDKEYLKDIHPFLEFTNLNGNQVNLVTSEDSETLSKLLGQDFSKIEDKLNGR